MDLLAAFMYASLASIVPSFTRAIRLLSIVFMPSLPLLSIRQLEEVRTRTHPVRLALASSNEAELAAELADEEAELAGGEHGA